MGVAEQAEHVGRTLPASDADLLVAAAWVRTCRGALPDEALVTRLGGDEFVIVLPRTDAAGAAEASGRIVEGPVPATPPSPSGSCVPGALTSIRYAAR
ncbi:hypothetical protein GCM10010166_61520 [Couchioplanes caeruleus subsp. azureus]|nr:hypothetical protein GCM10010166_61520 [Couchioplanes caeruleus subsp. azureus]